MCKMDLFVFLLAPTSSLQLVYQRCSYVLSIHSCLKIRAIFNYMSDIIEI